MNIKIVREVVSHCTCYSASGVCYYPKEHKSTVEPFYDGSDLLRQLREVWPKCPIKYIWNFPVLETGGAMKRFDYEARHLGYVEGEVDVSLAVEDVKRQIVEQIKPLIDARIKDMTAIQAGV